MLAFFSFLYYLSQIQLLYYIEDAISSHNRNSNENRHQHRSYKIIFLTFKMAIIFYKTLDSFVDFVRLCACVGLVLILLLYIYIFCFTFIHTKNLFFYGFSLSFVQFFFFFCFFVSVYYIYCHYTYFVFSVLIALYTRCKHLFCVYFWIVH